MQPTVTRDLNIKTTITLVTPIELVNELPVPSKSENTVAAGRDQVRRILNGSDSRFMVIVGPCSIHNEEAALEYDERL